MRRLRLEKETLRELRADELGGVAGGAVTYGCTYRPTLNTICVTEIVSLDACPTTGYYITLDGCV